jgi:hypothetical protein
MRAVDEFLRDPPEFLRRNHVAYVGQAPSPAGGGVYEFILLPTLLTARRRAGVFLGKSIGKADAGVYEIRYTGASLLDADRLSRGQRFDAIWSGFVAGGMVEVALDGAGPDIMLTPALSGCAVAFAAQPDGRARFSHYNIKNGDQTLDAAGMEALARQHYAGARKPSLVTKEDYRKLNKYDENTKHTGPTANVIGWRRNGQWTFWMQYVDVKTVAGKAMDIKQILEVRQMRPGSRIA